ncbi:MAG: response regulator transcription factor [Pseudomonadota bacterium]
MKHHVFLTTRPQPIPRWLQAFPDARVLREAEAGGDVLAEAGVIWLHAAHEGADVSAAVRSLRTTAPQVPVVVLSNMPEDEQGLSALAAGASGYCSALTLPAVLRQVAGVVEHGGLWVGPTLMRRLMQGLARTEAANEPTLDSLSQRERQVAEAVARGATNKEIARVMGVTERTIKAHLSAIFEKLGVRDRMQLALVVNGVENPTAQPRKIPA